MRRISPLLTPRPNWPRRGTGKEAKLCYSANALMENRHALLLDFQVEPADGFAGRRAAIAMVDGNLPGSCRITLAGDRGYDTRAFVASCRALTVTPHVAQNQARPGDSALDAALCGIRVTPSVSGSAPRSRGPSAG